VWILTTAIGECFDVPQQSEKFAATLRTKELIQLKHTITLNEPWTTLVVCSVF